MIDFVLNKNLVKYAKDFGFSRIYYVKELKIVEGKNDKVNRSAFESKNIDIVFGIEKFRGRDKLHYKDSGLNQVLCKLAKKNNIKYGISFSDVLKFEGRKRASILGKMLQNIRFCNKYKVDMIIGSFARNRYELRKGSDLVSFGKLLKMRKIWNSSIDKFFKEDSIGIKRVK